MSSISLLIVSDSGRQAELRAQAAACGGVSIVGGVVEASALHLAAALCPDVVLLDGAAGALNPLLALAWLHGLPDSPIVLYLAATASEAERRLALELGAVSVIASGSAPALRAALGLGRDLTDLARPLFGRLRAA